MAAAIAACGVGAVARFWIGTWRRPHHWPWPTLVANVVGTAVLGASASLLHSGALGDGAAWVLGAGLAGGLTTFSTLATEAVVLWRESPRAATAYLAVTAVAGMASGWAAWLLAAAVA